MAEAPSLDNRSSAAGNTTINGVKCTASAKKNKKSPCYEAPKCSDNDTKDKSNKDCYGSTAAVKENPNKKYCDQGLYCDRNIVPDGSYKCIGKETEITWYCCPKGQRLYDGVGFRKNCK
jgi:hypothetical protein